MFWTISQDTHMLFKLFNLGRKNINFSSLEFVIFYDFFQVFIKYFVLVSLGFDIALEILIIFPSFIVELILNHFSFFNEHVHHYVDLFTDLVSFFLEELEDVIAFDELILQNNLYKITKILTSKVLICLFTELETSSIFPCEIIYELLMAICLDLFISSPKPPLPLALSGPVCIPLANSTSDGNVLCPRIPILGLILLFKIALRP